MERIVKMLAKRKNKRKNNFIILFTACFLMLAAMIYGCSAAKEEAMEAEYREGIYTGVSKIVEDGGYSEITIEIVDNSITKASVVEYYGDKSAKDPVSYLIPVENGEGYVLGEILAALEAQIVEKNTYDVDIITGATESCIKVIQAAHAALQEAQKEGGEKGSINIEEKDRDMKDLLEKEPCKP